MTGADSFTAVPLALRQRRQWLLWRLETRPGAKKPAKMPYYASGKRRTGEQGGEADRAALVTFDEAVARAAATQASGIGFAFLPGDGLIGIDLDKMLDPQTGEIAPRALRIIDACASYTELSPSGTGYHIYVEGTTETAKDNGIGVEMFCGRQYFTVTGQHVPGTPSDVRAIAPRVLRRLHKTIANAKSGFSDEPDPPPPPSEANVLQEKIRSALVALSPSCGYDDWIRIGMALRTEMGEAGFDAWSAWSAGAENYPGDAVLRAHWKSFTSLKVKAGTLFMLAKAQGWQPPRRPRSGLASTPSGAGAGTAEKPATKPKREFDRPFIPAAVFTREGEFTACVSNVYQILVTDRRWSGVVAYDEFALQVVKRKPPPFEFGAVGEWDATDDTRTAMWLTREYHFAPSSAIVAEAIEALGRAQAFHPVRDWLDDQRWDKVKRVDRWLIDFLGVPDTPYIRRVARWWLMGAVARVLKPGCKFDYCLVLCGPQGKGKSTALSILGGTWFGDTDIDLGHKDGMSALRGKWIYEIAELGALARSEERRQKSFLSRQIDEYRPVYGRREIKALRQLVFSGTTNEHEWQKDPTGGRRFWPVECSGTLDLDGLRSVRDQLFAEAYEYVRTHMRYWPTVDEQRALFDPEQIRVEQQDSLVDMLHDWVFARVSDFSMAEAATDCLKMDAAKLTPHIQTRIGVALRKLGCLKVEKRNGMTRFWYRPPAQEGMASSTNRASTAISMGGGDDYF